MKIYYGTSRIVVIVGKIKIKIAKIRFFKFFKNIFFWLRETKMWRKVISYDIGCYGTPQYYLLNGIRDNWREFCFYSKTCHSFVVPTYFSLFGLINFGLTGIICEKDYSQIIYETVERKMWFDDIHHFSNPTNFCLFKNKFCVVDYASPETQCWVEKYGLEIQRKITALL